MSAHRSLLLYAPGLLHTPVRLDPANAPSTPTLARVLARARRSSGPRAGFLGDKDRALLEIFDLAPAGPLPVAALRHLGDTAAPTPGCVIAADPVHLRPDRDQLILFDAAQFPLRQGEADALVSALQELFEPLGARLHAATPQHWYLLADDCPAIETSALDQTSGRDLLQFMPHGAEARRWRSLLNETQMLLHQHPVNEAREANGLVPVNSLWFWGQGALPRPADSVPLCRVLDDDAVALGLARLHDIALQAPPADLAAWLDEPGADADSGACLLHFPDANRAHLSGDPAAWSEALQTFETQWLPELTAALSDGRLANLDLVCANGAHYRTDRSRLRRWWQRSRDLGRFLSAGSEITAEHAERA